MLQYSQFARPPPTDAGMWPKQRKLRYRFSLSVNALILPAQSTMRLPFGVFRSTYTYESLGHKRHVALREQAFRIARGVWSPYALGCLVLAIFGGLAWWMSSGKRQVYIQLRELSCQHMRWWYFEPFRETYSRRQISSLYSLPAGAVSNTSAPPPRIAHVQLCSRVYRDSWRLLYMLDNHRAYADEHGIEYTLYTRGGKERGVWRKVEILLEKINYELAQQAVPENEGLGISWLL